MNSSDEKQPPGHADNEPGPSSPADAIMHFGEFRIDRSTRQLMKGDARVRIQHKPLDVLIYLAENQSRLVTREELLDRFWPREVNEDSLTRCISTIRKLLGDVRDPPRYIETQWGEGYRFIIRTAPPSVAAHESLPEDADRQPASGETQDGSFRLGLFRRFSKSPPAFVFVGLAILAIALVVGLQNVFNSPVGDIDRIAVLPITAPDEEDWSASALTDQLIRTVSRIEGVTVVARGSASQFSAASDPLEIGKRLNVDAVLISELSRSGGSAGLRSELVSTTDRTVLWNLSVDPAQARTDEEQIQRLARAVARRLWANLQLRDADTRVDRAAQRHYLRGRYYWNQRSITGLSAAINAYNAALELEPEYVDALVGLADSWLLMPLYGAVAPNEAIPKARSAAVRALQLDSGEAHAYAVLGVISMQFDWDWAAAESHLRKALTLNPNDSTAEQWLGELFCYTRRFDECRRQLSVASGLDPLSPVLRMQQGSPALYSGDFEAAAAAYRRALEEVPNFAMTHVALGHSLTGLGDWANAIASYEASLPELGIAIVGGPLLYALAKNGDTDRANELLDELEALARLRYVPPSKLATAYLGLGDRDRALSWLWRAVEAHDDRLVYLAVDTHFIDLHADPEFRRIAARTGLLDVLNSR